MFLGSHEIRIVRKRLQDVSDLPEGLQYGLLVIGGRGFERIKRGATFSFSHPAIEDRLRKSRGDTPHEAGRVK